MAIRRPILVRYWAEVRIGKLLTRSLRRRNRRRAWFPPRISGEAPGAFAQISPRTNPTEDGLLGPMALPGKYPTEVHRLHRQGCSAPSGPWTLVKRSEERRAGLPPAPDG